MGAATAAALRDLGLDLDQDEIDRRVALAIRELAGRPRHDDPRAGFSPDEQAVLEAGGFDLGPRRAEEGDPGLRAAEQYAAILASALTVSQAARRIGVDGSRVRQRLLARELYGIRERRGWLIPIFQFQGNLLVPGLDRVLPRLDPGLHPLAAVSWFTRPHPDLYLPEDARETPVSPREWLLAGGDPLIVASLAEDAGGYS